MAHCYTELTLLREEERVLMKIASKLNDQLNRLKVEELALQSLIRTNRADVLQNKEASTSVKMDQYPETMINSAPLLDLEVKHSATHRVNEEEEEEDDDDDAYADIKHDQLTDFLEQMELQHRILN